MKMVYAIIDYSALNKLGVTSQNQSSAEKYQAMSAYINNLIAGGMTRDEAVKTVRELRVWKVDQNGNRRNGAEFALYKDAALTDEVVRGVTGRVGDQDGVLIFTPSPEETETGETAAGYAKVLWARSQHDTYYLKETKAPEGCELNDTVIPVHVGIYSIYADAGTPV